MAHKRIIIILSSIIVVFTMFATIMGIFSTGGPGEYTYETIREITITLYGIGIYRHMSSEVAIQGIAQDYVTLFLAIPFFIASLYFALKGSLRARFVFLGTVSYLFLTYLFYLNMAMYNALFLVYVVLLGATFFTLILSLSSVDVSSFHTTFKHVPAKFTGWFLVVNSMLIGLMWLSVVVPPLLDGTIYPLSLEHYTTLVVQGFDLGLMLPLSVVAGVLYMKKTSYGYLYGLTYSIFLSFLMTALCAKIIAMGLAGYNIVPAIVIIPSITVIAMSISVINLTKLKEE